MEPKIVFEDDQILVLDKPAGMVVNRATSVKEETVQDWVARNFQFPISNDQLLRNGIVHRLDKETSGLLLVAKTQEAFENLQRQFKERKVEKKYLALVSGKVEPAEGEINAPVGRLPWDREKFGVFPGGREAITKYKVVKYIEVGNEKWEARLRSGKGDKTSFSLLELAPATGRTHQIRVHLKYQGYPIVGDFAYGGRKQSRQQRKFCPRVFLHAASLRFIHPTSGEEECFESPLPEDLKRVLGTLNNG